MKKIIQYTAKIILFIIYFPIACLLTCFTLPLAILVIPINILMDLADGDFIVSDTKDYVWEFGFMGFHMLTEICYAR